MSVRQALGLVVLAASLLPLARPAGAQRYTTSATIAVTARVLAVASFDGGATHDLAAPLEPGTTRRIEPAEGARTRMTYNAAMKVVVRGTTLRGPGGASVPARLLCARGEPGTTTADIAFDCDAGFVAELGQPYAATVPLAVGAEIGAAASRSLPAGVYVGQVTFVAVSAGY